LGESEKNRKKEEGRGNTENSN
jgi:hypothetical protein